MHPYTALCGCCRPPIEPWAAPIEALRVLYTAPPSPVPPALLWPHTPLPPPPLLRDPTSPAGFSTQGGLCSTPPSQGHSTGGAGRGQGPWRDGNLRAMGTLGGDPKKRGSSSVVENTFIEAGGSRGQQGSTHGCRVRAQGWGVSTHGHGSSAQGWGATHRGIRAAPMGAGLTSCPSASCAARSSHCRRW